VLQRKTDISFLQSRLLTNSGLLDGLTTLQSGDRVAQLHKELLPILPKQSPSLNQLRMWHRIQLVGKGKNEIVAFYSCYTST
jgi:hypothetical protein